jgi:hypothetical protein
MDITDDGSARNRAIEKQITTHTRHLILSIPGEDQPSTLPIFCSLLDSISFAALEAMEFVGSHLDVASWTALDTLLNGSWNVQFSESLRLLDLPYSTSNDAFQKCSERKSGEMFSCYGDLKFNIYKDGRPHKMQVGFRGLTPNWWGPALEEANDWVWGTIPCTLRTQTPVFNNFLDNIGASHDFEEMYVTLWYKVYVKR